MLIDYVEFSTLALAHFIALISPGPDFILLIGNSFQYGYRKTFWTCLGIATANGIYILFAIGGFSLLRDNSIVFWCMKVAAASYLFYLGSLLLKSSQHHICPEKMLGESQCPRAFQMFWRGFLSAILNPKNAIFYLSLMALIVSRQTPIAHQLGYGIWMFSAVLIWDMFIAWGIGNPAAQKALNRYSWQIERTSGVILMFFGVVIMVR